MSLYEYNSLSDQQRQTIVAESGQYLTYRMEMNRTILLYSMGSFFVEVHYDLNYQLLRQRAFCTTNLLLPFIPIGLLEPLFPKN